ncbi:hypothetical protein VTK26DRAFT_6842 [Humicola hyalothermophila]
MTQAAGRKKRAAPHRKGHIYSCDFLPKTQAPRQSAIPCTNCVSREKECHFALAAGAGGGGAPVTVAAGDAGSSQPLPTNLAKEICWPSADFSFPSSTCSPGPSWPDVGPTHVHGLGQVGDVLAHLERMSTDHQSSHEPIYVYDDLAFRVERIRAIPQAPGYTAQLGKPTRCVWLPQQHEARVLLDKYVTNVGHIHHITHHPSLPAAIDAVYRWIGGQEPRQPVQPGHLVLLLSIIACATHVWAPHDQVGGDSALFASSAQANAQTPLWIKAAHDVLSSAGQNRAALAVETIQGIAILSFLIYNLEGVSLRYRSLVSTGLLLSRELGLHRIDHVSGAAGANTVRAELGRRVWWYLAATDWLLATRFGCPSQGTYQVNPGHMVVNKPRNIDDADLLDNGLGPGLPMSQPTEMSYFLQRIRLAEILRTIIDHNPMAVAGSGGVGAHAAAIDAELDRMIHDMPSFFNLDSYPPSPDSDTSSVFGQAYLLNSMIHTQRCKLHLAYLTCIAKCLDRGSNPMGALLDQSVVAPSSQQAPYCNPLAQSLEELIDFDGLELDELLSEIDSSFF